MTIARILRVRADLQADQTAFVFLSNRGREEVSCTYGQLLREAERVAAALNEITSPGDCVGCMFGTGPAFLHAFFGCLLSRRIAVPLPPPRPGRDIETTFRILRHAGAKVCLSRHALICLVPERDYTDRILLDVDQLAAAPWSGPDPALGDVAYLQYTSGSTGTPKGVMIGHDNLLANSQHICAAFDHSTQSRGVIWLPPHHDMGLVGGVLQPLYAGFPVYLLSPLDVVRRPASWLETIFRYRATTSGGPNFAYEMCVRRVSPEVREGLDLSSWRVAFCGAEPISATSLQRFAATFQEAGFDGRALTPCYGLAEATLMATCSPLGAGSRIASLDAAGSGIASDYVSCGVPYSDSSVLVIDPQSRAPVPAGTRGEIWIRSPSVAKGYWHDLEATRAVFGAVLHHDDGSTYLRTGDLGVLHDGELYICGRLRTLVIIRGVNHCLEDIERTVQSSSPHIEGYTCAAIGQDGPNGENVLIVQEAPPAVRGAGHAQELEASIRKSVVDTHGFNPAAVHLVPLGALPRTTSGKLRRDAAAHLETQGMLERAAGLVSEPS